MNRKILFVLTLALFMLPCASQAGLMDKAKSVKNKGVEKTAQGMKKVMVTAHNVSEHPVQQAEQGVQTVKKGAQTAKQAISDVQNKSGQGVRTVGKSKKNP